MHNKEKNKADSPVRGPGCSSVALLVFSQPQCNPAVDCDDKEEYDGKLNGSTNFSYSSLRPCVSKGILGPL